jgi:transcriptional regulator with XRE-family HTH domain
MFVDIGQRLREERERLGLSQAAMATSTEVDRKTQLNYESGEREPKAEYLARAAKLGVDVQYVVTSVRTPGHPASIESAQTTTNPLQQAGDLSVQDVVNRTRGAYAPAVDIDLMTACIRGVEAALQERGLALGDDRKSRLISGVYEMSLPQRQFNARAVDALLLMIGS